MENCKSTSRKIMYKTWKAVGKDKAIKRANTKAYRKQVEKNKEAKNKTKDMEKKKANQKT